MRWISGTQTWHIEICFFEISAVLRQKLLYQTLAFGVMHKPWLEIPKNSCDLFGRQVLMDRSGIVRSKCLFKHLLSKFCQGLRSRRRRIDKYSAGVKPSSPRVVTQG